MVMMMMSMKKRMTLPILELTHMRSTKQREDSVAPVVRVATREVFVQVAATTLEAYVEKVATTPEVFVQVTATTLEACVGRVATILEVYVEAVATTPEVCVEKVATTLGVFVQVTATTLEACVEQVATTTSREASEAPELTQGVRLCNEPSRHCSHRW
jgi:hypothetical protein